MKQVVQNYRTGNLWLEEVPIPMCRSGGVLVRNEFSVVSTGTERMKIDQARMSLLEKARARPDQVKQVLQSVSQTGLKNTYDKVQERLNALTTLGYSSLGTVIEVGAGIDEVAVGDRVVCAGEGIACHAEYVFVPRNLFATVPDSVNPRDAAFATIGAIAMNGVRQSGVSLGDVVLVIGLGLVGLLGVQILRAAGARVVGVDVASDKLELARRCGADNAFVTDDPALSGYIDEMTRGRGVDAVYIAASSKSSGPFALAGELIRDRGAIVVVGMLPIEADWRTFYSKELSVYLSRSYGPGRYDRNFEVKGVDYPVGFVPWTERRNLEEFIRLVDDGLVSPGRLDPHEFDFLEAPEAYRQIHESPGTHATGVLFRYAGAEDTKPPAAQTVVRLKPAGPRAAVGVGMIGAGNFATGTLLPALRKNSSAALVGICSAGGLSAKSAASKYGFQYATSSASEIFSDPTIDCVVIATRHDTHARFVLEAIAAGKHVFVEKPLALSVEDLLTIRAAAESAGVVLLPGFNRRFSPLSLATRDFFAESAGPLAIVCRINAGPIELDSWYQDADEGGWRIVSEGCHWIDLISFIAGAEPIAVSAVMVQGASRGEQNDNCIATIQLANGSIATLAYLSNGDPGFEKERIEVFGQSGVAVIDNWRVARLTRNGRTSKVKPRGTGKGHGLEMQALVEACRSGAESPIPLSSAIATSIAALKIQESLLEGGSLKQVAV